MGERGTSAVADGGYVPHMMGSSIRSGPYDSYSGRLLC